MTRYPAGDLALRSESHAPDMGHLGNGINLSAQRMLEEAEQRMQGLMSAANLKAVSAQRQLAADIRAVKAMNAESTQVNSRVRAVLMTAAGAPDPGG